MSIMHVFRAAAEAGDARDDRLGAPGGAAAQERAKRAHRDQIDEAELRRHLALDLESLISTIRLDASLPLAEDSRVARSVINYGFADLSRAGGTANSRLMIAQAIRNSLLAFEPRLIPDSISVTLDAEEVTETNRLAFHVEGEMSADPADLPLDFLAEVDLGSGKLRTRRLRLQR